MKTQGQMKGEGTLRGSALPAHFDPERVPACMRADAHLADWVEQADRTHAAYAEARKIVKTRIGNATNERRPLTCTRHPNLKDVFHVEGGKDPDGHTVDLHAAWGARCTCGDHMWGHHYCKHIIRSELENGLFIADEFPIHGVRRKGIYSRAMTVELANLARKRAAEEGQ
jgi:hypothetical protein